MAAVHGDGLWIQAPRFGGRLLQVVAILVDALGIDIDQPTRSAPIHLLSAPVGDRSGAATCVSGLAIAISSLYKLGEMRGAIAALAWRVPVRYRERWSCTTRVASLTREDMLGRTTSEHTIHLRLSIGYSADFGD